MTKLKILIDADDVAESLHESWVNALNKKYGITASVEDITDWDVTKAFPTLTKEQIFSVLQEDDVWANLTPTPGAQEYMQRLHDEGHDIYIVTATDFRTCHVKILRILELFPFLDAEHIVIAHNKQMVTGDVMIDDGPHNLVNGPYFRILFDRPHNRGIDEKKYGMYRATSWEEAYRLIHENLVFKPDNDIWRNISL